jgi:receptor expression-enhancing protein 1/2/3/4
MLYPAYCSYKAVKNKDVREYVHWMMYWIVFAFYSFFETFADTFAAGWFPFYYELKIVFMLWLLSPATRGGSVIYRRIIHPTLVLHEPEIDAYLDDFKSQTSDLVMHWGSRLIGSMTEALLKTALRVSEFAHSQAEHAR